MSEKSLMDELKEFVVEEEAKEVGITELTDDYKILDVDTANFFMKRLEELKTEELEINEMCDKEIEKFVQKINTFREEKLRTVINTQNYFKKFLEQYAEEQLANSTKKSIKLPFGTLQFRKSSVQYTYEDDTLLEFLKNHQMDSLITTKLAPNKADLKKVAEIKNGKVYVNNMEIPGVTVEEGQTKFDVKLNS